MAVTSLTVQSGKMQHMRVFRYGNDKDVRAQIVMSYDVLVCGIVFIIHFLPTKVTL